MQNKKPLHKSAFFTGLMVALCLVVYFFYRDNEAPYSVTSKVLRFNYALRNTSGEYVPSADFSIKIPMFIDGAQNVESIISSHKNEHIQTSTSEQSINFSVEKISPYASKIIDLTLVIVVTDQPKYERINVEDYLISEKYMELDSSAIKALAVQLKGPSTEETAKNIYEWLVNNVTSSSYTADSRGAEYVIKKRFGDCTELMYAFVALARANGIPARGISGFWVPGESTIINAADYHDWAEFYNGERWVLVDPSKVIFDKPDFSYIVGSYFHPDKNIRWQLDSPVNQFIAVQ